MDYNSITYTLPASKEDIFIHGNYLNTRFEIPAVFNEDGSLDEAASLDKLKLWQDRHYVKSTVNRHSARIKFNGIEEVDGKDEVYVAGELVRRDYNIGFEEGQLLLAELQASNFSDEIQQEVETNELAACIIGANDGYRPPYNNRIISWYKFTDMPAETIERFGVDTNRFKHLLPWYGRKFDLTENTVNLKIVYSEKDVDLALQPDLPDGIRFYSMYYNENKQLLDDIVDCYVWTSATEMRRFCSVNNLIFPAPANVADNIQIWGVAYNTKTNEYIVVKGYNFISGKTFNRNVLG